MSRIVLAQHLGYSSLNGRALAKIGALRAYGIIEGREDELKLSQTAIISLEAPAGSEERRDALVEMALNPSVFRDIQAEFPKAPSEANLRFNLVKRGYGSEAAGKAAANYLATMRLLEESGGVYGATSDIDAGAVDLAQPVVESHSTPKGIAAQAAAAPGVGPVSRSQLEHLPGEGMTQAVFPLVEGNVYLSFPQDLTADGYSELNEYLQIFLKRAERARRAQEHSGQN